MSRDEALLIATRVGEREIATSGDVRLVGVKYKFTRASVELLLDDSKRTVESVKRRLLLSDKEVISIDEAHNEYGLNKDTLRKLCRTRVIEARKANGMWYIIRDSLINYLDEVQ